MNTMNGFMNGIELETLNNTKLCWYCSNNKPAIGKQRKNGRTFSNNANGSNDWKEDSVRKYCKGCNARVCDMRMSCFDTYGKSFESEADEKAFIKINLDQHDSYLDYKMNKVQEIIDGRNQKKLDKKSKSKKPN